VIIYGERGVGKTSPANILEEVLRPTTEERRLVTRVNCGTSNSFGSLWSMALREGARLSGLPDPDGRAIAPEDVRRHLETLPEGSLVVIDELDRLEDQEALSLLADTIKTLSDHSTPVTLVLIGEPDPEAQDVAR